LQVVGKLEFTVASISFKGIFLMIKWHDEHDIYD